MFRSNVLQMIRISFVVTTGILHQNEQYHQTYIFDEITGDVLNINSKAYENRTEQPLSNALVKLTNYEYDDMLIFENLVWINLRMIFKFRVQMNIMPSNFQNGISSVLLERSDCLLAGQIKDNQHSLPTLRNGGSSMFMKRPDHKVSSTFFMDVFDQKVWWAVFGTLLIVTFVVIMYKMLRVHREIDVIGILFLIIGISSETMKIGVTIKWAQFMFGIFMILIMTAFSTFLLSELAIVTYKLPFHNLHEVFGQDLYKMCVASGSFISNTNGSWNGGNCPTDTTFYNYDFISSMFNHEYTVYLSEMSEVYFDYVMDAKIPECQIYKFPEVYFRHSATMLLRNGFNYDDQLHQGLLRIRTSGILKMDLDHAMNIDEVNFFYNMKDGDEGELEVEFGHVILIILVYLGLMLFSGFLLIIELVTYPKNKIYFFK